MTAGVDDAIPLIYPDRGMGQPIRRLLNVCYACIVIATRIGRWLRRSSRSLIPPFCRNYLLTVQECRFDFNLLVVVAGRRGLVTHLTPFTCKPEPRVVERHFGELR